jgi:glutathione S-transferase
MIVVHHLNQSRSQRVLWLLEELEIPYEIRRYERNPSTLLAPPELKHVHPLGKSPVVTDGERTVAESGAILEYIAERHGGGRLVPEPGTDEHLRCSHFLHYAEGSLMPPLLLALVFSRVESAPVPFFVRPVVRKIVDQVRQAFIRPQLTLHLGYVEAELASRAWLAGDALTLADIQMSYPLEAASLRQAGFTTRYPALATYLDAIRARPAYQRALERGGPVVHAS